MSRSYPRAAEQVRIQMVRCGYTLDRLSDVTGTSQAVLRGILTGRTTSISTRTVCALAQAFDLSAGELIDLLSE